MHDQTLTAEDVSIAPTPTVTKRWITTGLLAIAPWVLTVYQFESQTHNGEVVSERYRDWGALVAAIALAIVGLWAVPALKRASPRRTQLGVWVAVTLVIALAHGLRAFGIIGPRLG